MSAVAGAPRTVALAEWRLPGDRRAAVALARRLGAGAIQLDAGGGTRGPLLREDGSLAELASWRRDLVVDTIAVNRANDLGVHRDGRLHRACLDRVLDAIDLARVHGFTSVHVPSFRASAIVDDASFAATVELLARCARRAGPSITILTESALGVDDVLDLHDAIGEPTVRVVADTGNLLDAGHDPVDFVRECRAAGVLAPTIHVKAPATTVLRRTAAVTAELLACFPLEDVLLENDYRDRSDLLRRDLAATCSTHPEGAIR